MCFAPSCLRKRKRRFLLPQDGYFVLPLASLSHANGSYRHRQALFLCASDRHVIKPNIYLLEFFILAHAREPRKFQNNENFEDSGAPFLLVQRSCGSLQRMVESVNLPETEPKAWSMLARGKDLTYVVERFNYSDSSFCCRILHFEIFMIETVDLIMCFASTRVLIPSLTSKIKKNIRLVCEYG